MSALIPKAEQLCERLGISRFAAEMVLASLTRPREAGDDFTRVDTWMALLAQPEESALRLAPTPWQRGCPELIPGLRSQAVWFSDSAWRVPCPSSELAAFVLTLEREFQVMLEEVRGLRGHDTFQEYRTPSWNAKVSDALPAESESPCAASLPTSDPIGLSATSTGSWNVAYLSLHNASLEQCVDAQKRCPCIAALVNTAPQAYGHALLSALAPGTHVKPHVGSTNKKLRIHLPLIVPGRDGDCTLTVGGETLTLRAGRAVVFDDSFLHEAHATHAPGSPARVTLIIDVWHPDLSAVEIRTLSFLRNAALRQARLLSDGGSVPRSADFYAVLDDARERRAGSDGAVFGKAAVEEQLGRASSVSRVCVRDD